MHPMDASWRLVQPLEQIMLEEYVPNKPDVITICLSLDENVSTKWLHSIFIPRLLTHPRFSSKIVKDARGRFVYEPVPGFTRSCADLKEHHVSIESPVDTRESRKEQLRIFTSRLSEISSIALNRERPLWKVFLFPSWSLVQREGRLADDTSTIVLRVHHSLADGIGLVKYFLAEVADKPEHVSVGSLLIPPKRQRHTSQERNKSQRGSKPTLVTRCKNALQSFHLVSFKALVHDPPSILTSPEVQQGNLCAVLPFTNINVEQVKEASRALGITINDLLLAAVSGAIRSYLSHYGDNPNSMKRMRAAMPFNKHMFDKFNLSDVSNQLAMIPVPLNVHVESREKRVRVCAEAMSVLKSSHQPALVLTAFKTISGLPRKLRKKIWAYLAASTSVLFSNVAGPKEKVQVGEIEVEAVHFLPPCDVHTGANVGIFSYAGNFGLAACGDANRMLHPQKLLEFLQEEIGAIIEMSQLNS